MRNLNGPLAIALAAKNALACTPATASKITTLFLTGVLIANLAGCAFVQSATNPAEQSGVSYYLPLRPVKLTFTREIVQRSSTKELTKARGAYAATLEAQEAAEANLKGAESDLLLTPAGPAVALAIIARDKAKVAVLKAMSDVKKANDALIAAFETYRTTVDPNKSFCEVRDSLKAELLPLVADASKRYVANLKHHPFRSDNLTITTTASGLLSTANGTATDQTIAILVALSQSQAAIQFNASKKALFAMESAMPGPVNPCTIPAAKIEQILDPHKPAQRTAFASELDQVLKDAHHDLTLTPLATTPIDVPENIQNKSKQTQFPGLAYRRNQAYVLSLVKNGATLATLGLDLPQGAPTEMLALKASFGNAVTLNSVFENGMLTSHTDTRPSEALAIASIPFDVAKAALAVPATLLQFKLTNVTKENDVSAALRAQICADEKLAAARENRAVVSTRCVP